MAKLFYFDVETTGLNAYKNGIIQLACIVEIDGEVRCEKTWDIKTFPQDIIDDKALEINGKGRDDIYSFMHPEQAYGEIIACMTEFVDKFNRNDKFYPAGYNVKFDLDFLSAFFRKNNDNYFGSWFKSTPLDPMYYLAVLELKNKIKLENYKLETVCDNFGIKVDAHDALSDIKATRELIHKLVFRK